MHPKKQTWSNTALLVVFTLTLAAPLTSQSPASSQPPIVGGDGTSKDFKLSGPLGVIQFPRPPVKVPRTIRALLPRRAKVRLLQKLSFQPQDTLVVYDVSDPASSSPFMEILYPAVRIIRGNQAVGRVSLKRRTDDDPDWVFLEAGEIRLATELSGIALAFRSLGDGSASLYMVLSPKGQKYHTVLNRITGQGRLRADQEANLELWDANFGGECVWCNHRYSILSYRWNGSRLEQVRKTGSCRQINPDAMTDKPIEAVAHSLEGEYTHANESQRQEPSKKQSVHHRACDRRDPTRPVNKVASKAK